MKRLTLLGVTVLTVGVATLPVASGQESSAEGRGLRQAARCSERMLKGTYGVTLSGLRPGAGGALEQFVGVSLQTYDGQGNFTKRTIPMAPAARQPTNRAGAPIRSIPIAPERRRSGWRACHSRSRIALSSWTRATKSASL